MGVFFPLLFPSSPALQRWVGGPGNGCSARFSGLPERFSYGSANRQGMASQVAEKILFAVILSAAKNLLVLAVSNLQILRRLRLLRNSLLGDFFSNLFSRAARDAKTGGFSP